MMKKNIFFLILLAITNDVFSSELPAPKKTEPVTNGCIAQVLPMPHTSNSNNSLFIVQPETFLRNPHIRPQQSNNPPKKRSALEPSNKK